MQYIRKLPLPSKIKAEFAVHEKAIQIKKTRDSQIKNILNGNDSRFLLIIGPCSADNEIAVLDYISRLHQIQGEVKDKILIIPRIYTHKPRTLGVGYKGMLYSPNPREKPDMVKGLIAIRKLYLQVLNDYHFSPADEMLYPQNYSYFDDLLSYVTVGARTVENQHHRLVASGIDIPVGMKNPTNGNIKVMLNAIYAAQHKQIFEYRGWECQSEGNPYAHVILRGFTDKSGKAIPNYHYENLRQLADLYQKSDLQNPAVIIDTNHANSNKNYLEQIRISHEILHHRHLFEEIRHLVKGLMIESYLKDGAQEIVENVYGKSITDACLGWEKSKQLIYEIADAL